MKAILLVPFRRIGAVIASGSTSDSSTRLGSIRPVAVMMSIATIGTFGVGVAHAQITAGISTFGLYSENSAYINNATIQPNIAIGGSFTESSDNWGVSGTTSLYVDGAGTLSGGNVNGAFKIGGLATLTNVNQSTSDQTNDSPAPNSGSSNQLSYTKSGTGTGTTGVNFSSSYSNFTTMDSGLIANDLGTTTGLTSGALVFTVTGSPTTAYFNVTAQNVTAATGISLVGASSTTTIVINILANGATSFTFPTNSNFSGFTTAYTLFNVQSGIAGFSTNALVSGSILAPYSELIGDNNQGIRGNTIVNSVGTSAAPVSGGQIGGTAFAGTFSFTNASAPEPTALAMLSLGGTFLTTTALRKRRRV